MNNTFKNGDVVYLKSDVKKLVPMTVIRSEEDFETEADCIIINVFVNWFNSQKKVEYNCFPEHSLTN